MAQNSHGLRELKITALEKRTGSSAEVSLHIQVDKGLPTVTNALKATEETTLGDLGQVDTFVASEDEFDSKGQFSQAFPWNENLAETDYRTISEINSSEIQKET